MAKNLTNISIVVGCLGVLALLFAWWAGIYDKAFGFAPSRWYADAAVLLMIAIWLKLGAIYHKGGM